jgi:ribonuclease BN (tRNA processing enzyme)
MHGGCGCGSAHDTGAISRRTALVAAGSTVLGGGLLGAATGTSAAQLPQAPPTTLPDVALITVGVQAGPPPIPGKIGISSTLKIGNDLYVIDCGLGSLNGFTNAGLKFSNVRSMFITHLHTDHIVDYFSFFISGGSSSPVNRAPVRVYGPGPAGGLPPSEVGDANPATVYPDNPTPGLAATTAALTQAFAYASNIFIRDTGQHDVQTLVDPIEIAVPPGSDYQNRAPRMDPFPVMSDENVTVTAILVPHYDVYPAFAFRFDLKQSGVSVTFSGDTTKSDNVIALAQGTDDHRPRRPGLPALAG